MAPSSPAVVFMRVARTLSWELKIGRKVYLIKLRVTGLIIIRTKTLYQNNFKYITVLFAFSKRSRYKHLPEEIISTFRYIVQTEVKFHHQLHFTSNFQVFYMNFKLCFRHLVLLETISFEKIFKTVAKKFAIQCK